MKEMLKQNKGFSLVELLVAILIMAVIAGTAITLFGGVLNSSREGADEETAESLKRAILTYMNMTNDTNLNCLNMAQPASGGGAPSGGWTESVDLIEKLSCTITIADDSASGSAKEVSFELPAQLASLPDGTPVSNPSKVNGADESDLNGTYNPFVDGTKDMVPKTPGTVGWYIRIDAEAQVITVEPVDSSHSPGPVVVFE